MIVITEKQAEVIDAIEHGKETVNEIAEKLGKSPKTVRDHAANLRKAGLLSAIGGSVDRRYIRTSTDFTVKEKKPKPTRTRNPNLHNTLEAYITKDNVMGTLFQFYRDILHVERLTMAYALPISFWMSPTGAVKSQTIQAWIFELKDEIHGLVIKPETFKEAA